MELTVCGHVCGCIINNSHKNKDEIDLFKEL